MQTYETLEITTRTANQTLPEAFGVSLWNEDDILSYTVLTAKRHIPREIMLPMVKDAMADLESRLGLNNELHWVCRIEGGHRKYLNATVMDPNIKRPHAHILIGKEKITNSNKNPHIDWKFFNNLMTGRNRVWKYGIVHNKQYTKGMNGPLHHGALVYNFKALDGCSGKEWDDLPEMSRMLRRHLQKLSRLSKGCINNCG